MSESPNARTARMLRRSKLLYEITEYRPLYGMITKDLLGIFDILVIDPRIGTLGIQASTLSNRGARQRKIAASKKAVLWLNVGNDIEIWSWRKLRAGWRVTIDRAVLNRIDWKITYIEGSKFRRCYNLGDYEQV